MIRTIKTLALLLISIQALSGQARLAFAPNNTQSNSAAVDSIGFLNLPLRPDDAAEGAVFAALTADLSLDDREKAVVEEILTGNVPSFSRKLRSITINRDINGQNYALTFFAVCDYMAVGSDEDYLYIPMRPSTAQYLADHLNCTLPTKKMVDIIYSQAQIKLRPQPIPPSDKMTTVLVFKQHTDSVKRQIARLGFDRSADYIIAGHKKDIIISNKIYSSDRDYERVVIYGWHLSENNPIQPVYNGHSADYADYSHGVRLIADIAYLNGDSILIEDLLKDSDLSVLLSDEGVIGKAYYPPSDLFTSMGSRENATPMDFSLSQNYPNPFNPATTIPFVLPKAGRVSLKIFNVLGEEIEEILNGELTAGLHKIEWNGRHLPSGVYFYRLQADELALTKKLIMIK